MAQTFTQKSPETLVRIATGRLLDTGTVASSWPMTITLGFKPRYVRCANLNASGDVTLEWYEGMANASAVKHDISGTQTLIATLGITPTADGFIMGFDLDLVVTSEQISWLALG